MDNFMDRLVERMNDRDQGYEADMPQDEGRYSSAPRGRMEYNEPDDGYGYGRPQRTSAPSVGRRDLEELGRAVISAQKKISDSQTAAIDSQGRNDQHHGKDDTQGRLEDQQPFLLFHHRLFLSSDGFTDLPHREAGAPRRHRLP